MQPLIERRLTTTTTKTLPPETMKKKKHENVSGIHNDTYVQTAHTCQRQLKHANANPQRKPCTPRPPLRRRTVTVTSWSCLTDGRPSAAASGRHLGSLGSISGAGSCLSVPRIEASSCRAEANGDLEANGYLLTNGYLLVGGNNYLNSNGFLEGKNKRTGTSATHPLYAKKNPALREKSDPLAAVRAKTKRRKVR